MKPNPGMALCTHTSLQQYPVVGLTELQPPLCICTYWSCVGVIYVS
jgi:hypothetical protein